MKEEEILTAAITAHAPGERQERAKAGSGKVSAKIRPKIRPKVESIEWYAQRTTTSRSSFGRCAMAAADPVAEFISSYLAPPPLHAITLRTCVMNK